MASYELHFTGHLARAARALVETSAEHTAAAAGLTHDQLREFERGNISLSDAECAALRAALERLGAMFLADGPSGRGYGVRLKFSRVGTKRVETWEDEGGLAGEDDV